MYDVLIAGAGSAGAALAGMLAARGRSVLLVDARERARIGHDWCGSVEHRAFQITGVGGPAEGEVRSAIKELTVASPDLRHWRTIYGYPSHIIDRKLLSARLLAQAEEAGAEFRPGCRALYPLYDERKVFGAAVEAGGEVENVMARVTVDATGIDAHLRTKLPPDWEIDTRPVKRRDQVLAYHEVREFDDREAMEPSVGVMSLRYGKHGWYSWVNRESVDRIDFGSGVVRLPGAPSPKRLTRAEIEGWKGVSRKIIRTGGGRLPARRAIENGVWDGFLVLGDAAAQSMPLNGNNTGTALIAARVAADVLDDALGHPRVGIDRLWRYNVQYQRGRGAVLAAYDAIRRTMLTLSPADLDRLFAAGVVTTDLLSRAWHFKPLPYSVVRAARNLVFGAAHYKLVSKMNRAAKTADEVLRHYHRYPQSYDRAEFRIWMATARSRFNRIGEP